MEKFGKVDYLIKLVKLSATALSLTLPLIRTLLKKSSAVGVNKNSTVWTWVSRVHHYVFPYKFTWEICINEVGFSNIPSFGFGIHYQTI